MSFLAVFLAHTKVPWLKPFLLLYYLCPHAWSCAPVATSSIHWAAASSLEVASLVALSGKESACRCWRCSVPGSGRSPGEGNGMLSQYSWCKIPWTEEPATVHGVTEEVGTMYQLYNNSNLKTQPIERAPICFPWEDVQQQPGISHSCAELGDLPSCGCSGTIPKVYLSSTP